MFYLVFRVVPTAQNEYASQVEGASALCWVHSDDSISATNLARFKVRQLHWDIVGIEEQPITVTEDDCRAKEMALERYRAAQSQGISIAFAAWSRDGKTTAGPIELKKTNDFDLGDYLSRIAELKQTGRCLHFDAGTRCTEPINAHSIQRNGALSLIAQCGHVYVPSKRFSDTKRNLGAVMFAKQGINTVSTFQGFCGKHDNELFEPIDNFVLEPTPEQITLYSYRSVCREIFLKENTIRLFEELANGPSRNQANNEIFNGMLKGSTLALRDLTSQKGKFELLLKSKSFKSIKSILFHSKQKPSVVFSGLLFPDYDFLGTLLQDLGNQSRERDLIAFSSAAMRDGWGFLFAWHDDSSESCVPMMRSLPAPTDKKSNLGDLLFRFVMSNCENLALDPVWWESLADGQKADIERLATGRTNIFSPLNSDYLSNEFEGLSEWEFDYAISSFDS